MRSKNDLVLLAIVGLTLLAGYEYFKLPFRKGLDITGGIATTYQIDFSKLPEDERPDPAWVQERTIRYLGSVYGGLTFPEARVEPMDNDKIVVEVPGNPADIQRAEDRSPPECVM